MSGKGLCHYHGQRASLLTQAQNILRARLNLQGTTLGFSTERSDDWWWLMASPDRNANRLLLAVLERRVGVAFGQLDVFVNVVGGIRLREPASDLAIAVALVSAALDSPVGEHVAFIGEVGLGGELRGVPRMERRLAEAERQGFGTLFVPAAAAPAAPDARIAVRGLEDLAAIVAEVFPRP